MAVCIISTANISAQGTFDDPLWFENLRPAVNGVFMAQIPPSPASVPATMLRRSSRILKMGITAGTTCLERAGISNPDAIITGTGIGCFEDSDRFLRSIDEQQEKMLNPTPFIQSTHNTIAGQLALLTKCRGYNLTYSHQNLSFENALIDAKLLLEEGSAGNVLVGGADDLNPSLTELLRKNSAVVSRQPTLELGEGAAFFCLAKCTDQDTRTRLAGIHCFAGRNEEPLQATVNFLSEYHLSWTDIDVLLSGKATDGKTDERIISLEKNLSRPAVHFKKWCGEHFTSTAFALWLGHEIIRLQALPGGETISVKNMLIVNHYNDELYSLILLRKC